MGLRGIGLGVALALGLALPAAAWTTQAGGGAVVTRQSQGGWTLEMRCARDAPGRLAVTLSGPRADSLSGVTQLLIAAELPGGDRRAARVPVTTRGPVASGTWEVGPRGLEIFAQGIRMGIRLREGERPLVTDMDGTAAARAAFQRECGF